MYTNYVIIWILKQYFGGKLYTIYILHNLLIIISWISVKCLENFSWYICTNVFEVHYVILFLVQSFPYGWLVATSVNVDIQQYVSCLWMAMRTSIWGQTENKVPGNLYIFQVSRLNMVNTYKQSIFCLACETSTMVLLFTWKHHSKIK